MLRTMGRIARWGNFFKITRKLRVTKGFNAKQICASSEFRSDRKAASFISGDYRSCDWYQEGKEFAQ